MLVFFFFGIAATIVFSGWSVMIFALGWEAGRNNVLDLIKLTSKEDRSKLENEIA